MSISIEQIRLITIKAQTQGVSQAETELDGLAESQAKVATSAGGMATSTDTASKSASRLATSAQGLLRAVDPLYAAQTKLEGRQRTLTAAFNQGALSSNQMVRALLGSQQAYDAVAARAQAAASQISAANARIVAEEVSRRATAQTNINQRYGVRDDFDASGRAADIAAYGSELDRVRAKYDPLFAAGQRYKADLSEIRQAHAVGAISATLMASALDRTKTGFVSEIESLRGVKTASVAAAAAHDIHTHAMGNARASAMELEHSVRAIGDALAAGANPLRVFSMEFSRLAEAASMSPGGVGGMFRSAAGMFAPMLRPLLSPIGLGATGALAAGGFAAYSYLNWESQLSRMQTSLNGPGRALGLTPYALADLSGTAGDRTGLTRGQSYGLGAELAQSGRIPLEMISEIVGISKRYSQMTGQSLAEGGKELAAGISDPVKGMATLGEKVGEFDARTQQMIKSAAASGDAIGAMRLSIDHLKEAASLAADRTWAAAELWDQIKSKASGFADRIGEGMQRGFDPTTQQRRASDLKIQKRLQDALSSPGGDWFRASDQAQLAVINKRLAEDDAKLQSEQAKAALAKVQENAAHQSNLAAGAIARLSPDQGARFEAQDTAKLLNTILEEARKDPTLAASLPHGFSEITGASMSGMDTLAEQARKAADAVADAVTPMQRLVLQTNAAIAAMNARTLSEKVAAEQEKLLADLGRDQIRTAQDAIQVEAKRVDLLTQANHALEDAARQSSDNLSLAGLKPFDRAMKEIEIKNRNLVEGNVYGAPSTMPRLPGIPGAPELATPPSPYGTLDDPFHHVTPETPKNALSPSQQLAVLAAQARQEGSPGNRPDYNNPGNIMFGRWAASHGATGSGLAGVAKFPSLDVGVSAQHSVVFGQNPDETLGQMSYRYLGHGTGGDAPLYASRLAAAANHAVGTYGSTAAPAGWPVGAVGVTPAVQPGAATMASGAMSDDQSAYWKNYTGAESATAKAIEQAREQSALLTTQRDMWGASAEAIAKATTAQELWNQVARDGITEQGLINKYGADGEVMWKSLSRSIATASTAAGTTAGQQQQQQQQLDQINQLNDGLRSFTSGSLGDIANDFSQSTTKGDILGQLTRGQQNSYYTGHTSLNQAKWEAAQRQIQGLASKTLINYGVGELTKGFFGSGSPGSNGYQPGLLGGFLNGGLGSLFGLGGGGSLSGVQSLLGGGGGGNPWLGVPTAHTGGRVGDLASTRMVDMSIFDGAPRFHGGGLVAGERAIIAKNDEHVLTPSQMKAMGSGGGGVTIHHAPQTNITVQGSMDEKVVPMVHAMIAQSNAANAKNLERTINTVNDTNARLYG